MKHLDTIWFCAFRYCLGRMTYVVSDFEEAFLANFDEVPDTIKKLMLKELRQEFERDDSLRKDKENGGWAVVFLPLGNDCDRASWKNILTKLEEWEKP